VAGVVGVVGEVGLVEPEVGLEVGLVVPEVVPEVGLEVGLVVPEVVEPEVCWVGGGVDDVPFEITVVY
jgi:hypothetical protein